MPLVLIRGEISNSFVEVVSTTLAGIVDEGFLYLGYPILFSPAGRIQVDALLVSPSFGLIAFQVYESPPEDEDSWRDVIERQYELFANLEGYLSRQPTLRDGRKIKFKLDAVTILGTESITRAIDAEGIYCGLSDLSNKIANLGTIEPDLFENLQSVLQRVSNLNPGNKRASVVNDDSRGGKLKKIEKSIANLDPYQNLAAIETPAGPQRIRGLAGSGKTIVLALKASLLQSQHPEWDIVVTFQSRALYQQFENLIQRFTAEVVSDVPDFSKLRVMHAWGSKVKNGFYQTIADSMGFQPRDYAFAIRKWGFDGAFAGICKELLESIDGKPVTPIFDAVLIDEAQDFPPEFFQLVYLFTKSPKRIVWGYDELQKLSEDSMPTMKEMFGVDSDGGDRVSLENIPGQTQRDIILPTCYRNSDWALATAHALGYGVYREEGLVQHFDDPKLWTQVGYEVVDGELALGRSVSLKRSLRSTPNYFREYLNPEDAVLVQVFETESDQDNWVAGEIEKNLKTDELEETDILIVLPSSWSARNRAISLRRALTKKGIDSHLVGVDSSADSMIVPGSVAIAHVYRAKGNEAPMVYAVDSHLAAAKDSPVLRRNSLFTAITRSKAWVRIVGVGEGMRIIEAEIQKVKDSDYKLTFSIPDAAGLARLRRQYSREGVSTIGEAIEKNIELLVDEVDSGQATLDLVSPEIRQLVENRIRVKRRKTSRGDR